MANHYDVPSWAGKPPTGYHLDVLKDDKLVQKLMIDEKKCYLFGRNAQLNDFCTDHASCSRVHAAFVFHKNLQICYLVDLGSTHGTFIGNLRLEAHKPTQLPMNSTFHFGASTRKYVLRERPSAGSGRPNIMEDIPLTETGDGTLLGLPESQSELDNLTEYNTATNRRISMLGITDDSFNSSTLDKSGSRKRSIKNVSFNDEEIIINPEDVDPSVGRFRNMIQSTVVPVKRAKLDASDKSSGAVFSAPPTFNQSLQSDLLLKQFNASLVPHLASLDPTKNTEAEGPMGSIGAKLSLLLPNPAPDVAPLYDDEDLNVLPSTSNVSTRVSLPQSEDERIDDEVTGDQPKKKKYAKEAWPGRKSLLSGL